MMQDFAQVLVELIKTRGLTQVRYVTIQNEVNSTAITMNLYEQLYRALDAALRRAGVREQLSLIGGDLVQNGADRVGRERAALEAGQETVLEAGLRLHGISLGRVGRLVKPGHDLSLAVADPDSAAGPASLYDGGVIPADPLLAAEAAAEVFERGVVAHRDLGELSAGAGFLDELDRLEVGDRADPDRQPGMSGNPAQVLFATGRQVVEHRHFVAALDQTFHEMAADKARPPRDQTPRHSDVP